MLPSDEGTELSEDDQVMAWRYVTLVCAGYPEPAAARLALADNVDLHKALGLIEHGCPPDLAERILL